MMSMVSVLFTNKVATFIIVKDRKYVYWGFRLNLIADAILLYKVIKASLDWRIW